MRSIVLQLERILNVSHPVGANLATSQRSKASGRPGRRATVSAMSEMSDSVWKTLRNWVNRSPALKNEDSVNEKYFWMAAYKAAILGADDAAMSLSIYEALAAIEQRRLSFLEIDGEERQALEDAERGLRALKAERIDPSGTQ
jgi:hypothetical protein